MESRIIVLTGTIGSGKTTLCTQLASLFRQSGTDVAGIVSPPRFENDVKTGIWVQNVRTREQRLLAEHAGMGEGTAGLRWRFDPSSIRWGAEILKTATPCELLFIDELGPLELIHGEGWSIAFDILNARAYHTALVVVRHALLPDFFKRVPDLPVTLMTVTRENRVPTRNDLILALVADQTQPLST